MYYLYGNSVVYVGFKSANIRRTGDDRRKCKLHLDTGIERADVPVKFESVQFDSHVDVSTSSFIRQFCGRVDSNPRSFCVVDLTTVTLLQLFNQVIRQTNSRHSTQHRAAFWVSKLDFARLHKAKLT